MGSEMCIRDRSDGERNATMLGAAVLTAEAGTVLLIDEPEHRLRLHDNIEYFLQCAEQYELPLQPSRTAIQPLILDDPESALAAGRSLSEQGFVVCAIRPPTVPEGTSRLRITLSARHTREQIEHFTEALAACCPVKLAR